MKHLTFSLLFIAFSTSISFAQDLITKKNGEDIKAKVLEVTPTEIKFNKLEIPNGPIFSILKSEVLIIRYENGSKDVFNETQQVTAKNNMPDIEKKQIEKKVATVIKISYGVKAGINYANLTNSFFDTKSIFFHCLFYERQICFFCCFNKWLFYNSI